MRKSNKRTIAIIAAVVAVIVLTVILLLFFLNDKGSDTPDTSPTPSASDTTTPGNTPDNSMPTQSGDTTTPDNTTPDPGTSTPPETPGESNPPDTSEPSPPETPTLKHPIDDPNVTPHPDSPYAQAKAGVDENISLYNSSSGVDLDKLISDTNETYAVIVNPDVVNPTFLRVYLATIGNNNTVNDRMYARVNAVLQENGFRTLQGNGVSNRTAAIIYMNIIAQDKGYGPDDLFELVYSYYVEGYNDRQMGLDCQDIFSWCYYPWMSKDAP